MMVLAATDKSMLVALLKMAKDAYYNGGTFYKPSRTEIPQSVKHLVPRHVIDDATYDALEDHLRTIDPGNAFFKQVGAAPKVGKVKLPTSLPSLDKRKTDIVEWIDTDQEYTVCDKIDGVSLLIDYTGKERRLYTRGDGTIGQDITHLAPLLRLPDIKTRVMVRAELVITEAKFAQWSKKFANARNMIAGLANRKTAHSALADATIVAYELITGTTGIPHADQLAKLKQMGFTVPWSRTVGGAALLRKIEDWLADRRTSAKYAVDGLVVTENRKTKRALSGNPSYAVAFKADSLMAAATVEVVAVEWNRTRTNMLFPRIVIKPIKLGGVTVTYCSGKSGAFIRKSKIDAGAVLQIVRSGDVIPDVRAVVKPAQKGSIPDVPFTTVGDNYFAESDSDTAVLAQRLSHFFTTIGVEGFKTATIQKLVDAGYTTVKKVYELKPEKAVALTSRAVLKPYAQMHSIKDVPLYMLMYATGLFGRNMGSTRLRAICDALDVLNYDGDNLVALVDDIEGFDSKTATQFAKQLPKFRKWLKFCPFTYVARPPRTKRKGSSCDGHRVLFTGFRDKALEQQIVEQGGLIASSVGRATHLLCKDPNSGSAKNNAARAAGIPVMTADAYRRKYGL